MSLMNYNRRVSLISRIYSLFVAVLMILGVLCPLLGMEEGTDGALPPHIRQVTIGSYEEVLECYVQDSRANPSETYLLLTDRDLTLGAITDLDHKSFHRQENTNAVIEAFKEKGVPVIQVTARWKHHTADHFSYHVTWAQSMETESGICFSNQRPFENVEFDLRDGSLDRGIFTKGTCFTGSKKGQVTVRLIDDPRIVKATHYFFVDDDPTYTAQMIDAFKNRQEKLTVFYYPLKVEKEKHPAVLRQLIPHSPVRSLSFFLRHNYVDEVKSLLANEDHLPHFRKAQLMPLLVDLLHSEHEEIAPYVIEKLQINMESLDKEEVQILLKKHGSLSRHNAHLASNKWLL
jgi:hypothetical protein